MDNLRRKNNLGEGTNLEKLEQSPHADTTKPRIIVSNDTANYRFMWIYMCVWIYIYVYIYIYIYIYIYMEDESIISLHQYAFRYQIVYLC
jgi:hypothetical protein